MYPRIIEIDNSKLIELEQQKGALIEEGREFSRQIEALELEMGKINTRLEKEEAKVDIKDLKIISEKIGKQMDESLKYYREEIKKVQKDIFNRMKAKTDPKLREQYEELTKQKELLETERNKKALKAQKFKDRIVPLARKLMKPFLQNKYEDFYDIQLKDGKMVGQIFSHLDEFEKNFEKKQKEKYLLKSN